MKILVLCTTYPRDKNDASSIFLKTLYESIANNNTSVHIRIVAANDSTRNSYESGNIILGIKRFNYWFRKFQTLAYKDAVMSNLNSNPFRLLLVPFFILGMLITGLKEAYKFKPDIVHAHWALPCGIVGVIIKYIFKCQLIVTSHGGDVYGFTKGIGSFLLRWIYKRTDIINPVSQPLKEEILSITKGKEVEKMWVQSMGVDPTKFYYIPNSKTLIDFDEEKKLLLFVGRLSEVKGLEVLLNALVGLKENNWECWIIGDGNLKEKIEMDIAQKDLKQKVKLIGSIPNDQLKTYYSASDILLIPSAPAVGGQEGLPVTLMEGLLCKCSIIASTIGGMKLFTNSKQVVLVEPGNSLDLRNTIIKKWIGTKIDSGEGEEFTIKRVAGNYCQKYSSLNNNSD